MCCFLWFKFVGLNSVLQQNDDISVSVNIFKLISAGISILKNKRKCFLKARVHDVFQNIFGTHLSRSI